jgi:hypothetical protein
MHARELQMEGEKETKSLPLVCGETKQHRNPRCKGKKRRKKQKGKLKGNHNHIAFFSSPPSSSSATHLASSLAKKSSLRMPERSHMPLKIPPRS